MPQPDADIPMKQTVLHCIECGYNLTGVCSQEQPYGHCPECGAEFDRAELIRWVNDPPPLPRWPMRMLFVWPVLAAALFVLLLFTNTEDAALGSLGLFLLCGVGQSVYAGGLMARHKLDRLPGSRPISSVVLTILMTIGLTAMQIVLFGALLFAGCVCVISTVS